MYTIGLTARRGQTLGQKALGVRVMDPRTGGPPTWREASLQWAATSLLPVPMSFLPTPPFLLSLRELQPQIDRVRREHKGDRHKLDDELMELYRSRHISPWAGLAGLSQVLLFQVGSWAVLRIILKRQAGVTTTTQPGVTTTRPDVTTTTQPGVTTTRPGATTTTQPGVTTTQPGVTTTRATGPTTSLVRDDQRLRECERQARDAKVSYAPRQAIDLGETLRVQVSASIDGVTVTTSTPTTGRVTTTVVPVTLRCEVEAQVRGEDFRVKPSEFQVGSFLDRPVVTWSWDVVALKAGTRTLTLEIRSIAVIDGRKFPGAGGELFTTAIDVGVKPEGLGEKLTRWSGDVVEHPLIKGFGSLAVVAAALAAAWRWLLKRPWPWTKKSKPAAPRRRKARR